MKSIFFFYPSIFPVVSGMSVHGYNLLKEFAKLGFKIKTYNQRPHELFEVVPHRKYYRLIKELWNADYIYYRTGFEFTKFEILLYLVKRKSSVAIIEVNAPLEELIISRPDIPITKFEKRIFRYKLISADKIVVVSKILKEYLTSEYYINPTKVVVAPNGGTIEQTGNFGDTFLSKVSNRVKVFWAGDARISTQNYNNLLTVANELREHDELLFVYAGNRKIEGSRPNVIMLPPIDYNEINKYINDSDILLVYYDNYDWCPIGFYNSSLKYFDYMASGKPVVASNKGQISDISVHLKNSYLFNDIEELKKGILYFLKNKEKHNIVGKEARRLIKNNYTWSHTARIIDSQIFKNM